MKKEIIVLLSGLGYYRLSEERRRILRYVLLGSLGVHILAFLIFGSIVLSKAIRGEKTTFEATPAAKTYEPRKLEFKVKVQRQQRSSSRPSMIPRMVSTKINTGLALPEIKMDPKAVRTSFQPKFKAVSGVGMGAGFGSGFAMGGFGTGVSSFDFFGIKGRGDKIAILVDVSVSMVEPERGGIRGFVRVKNRINEVIDALNENALFNVIVFADAASVWQTKLMIASKENKTAAKQYLRPFNTDDDFGLTAGNISPSSDGLASGGGTTRLDLALTAAFEQGADTILVISDGIPRVRKVFSSAQVEAHQKRTAEWWERNSDAVRAAQEAGAAAAAAAAAAATPVREERVWVPPQPARPPSKVLKEGQPIDRGAPATQGYWTTRRVGGPPPVAAPPVPQPPGLGDPGWWSLNDFINHLKMLHEKLYLKNGKKPPVVHTIGYAIDKEGGDFLRSLAEYYKGRYRRVAKID